MLFPFLPILGNVCQKAEIPVMIRKNTRSKINLYINLRRSHCIQSNDKRHGDRSFNVVAPVLWNSLPESMKSSSSVASFKRTLKTFLFRQEYGAIN